MAINNQDIWNRLGEIQAILVQVQSVQNSHTSLLNGLVSAGQTVAGDVSIIKNAVGQSEDGATLHSIVDANSDVLVHLNDTCSEIETKIGAS